MGDNSILDLLDPYLPLLITVGAIILLVASFIQLSYFGWAVPSDKKTLDPKDWRRKFLIVYAYILWIPGIILCFTAGPIFGVGPLVIGLVMNIYLGWKFSHDDDVDTDSKNRTFLIVCAYLVIVGFVVAAAVWLKWFRGSGTQPKTV